jgi:hypothetical protein
MTEPTRDPRLLSAERLAEIIRLQDWQGPRPGGVCDDREWERGVWRKAVEDAAAHISAQDQRHAELVNLVQQYPEFEADLDETACPTDGVTCLICGGGGSLDGRRRCPPKHRDDCPRGKFEAALAQPPGDK